MNTQSAPFPPTVRCPSCVNGWMGQLRCNRCDGRGNSQPQVVAHYEGQCNHRWRALPVVRVASGRYRREFVCDRCNVKMRVESDD